MVLQRLSNLLRRVKASWATDEFDKIIAERLALQSQLKDVEEKIRKQTEDAEKGSLAVLKQSVEGLRDLNEVMASMVCSTLLI
jgi:hypothetical protein